MSEPFDTAGIGLDDPERVRWFISWGDETTMITPGLGRTLTRWERLRVRIKAPFWRLRYVLEDLSQVTRYRIEGAWRVLLGRSHWD